GATGRRSQRIEWHHGRIVRAAVTSTKARSRLAISRRMHGTGYQRHENGAEVFPRHFFHWPREPASTLPRRLEADRNAFAGLGLHALEARGHATFKRAPSALIGDVLGRFIDGGENGRVGNHLSVVQGAGIRNPGEFRDLIVDRYPETSLLAVRQGKTNPHDALLWLKTINDLHSVAERVSATCGATMDRNGLRLYELIHKTKARTFASSFSKLRGDAGEPAPDRGLCIGGEPGHQPPLHGIDVAPAFVEQHSPAPCQRPLQHPDMDRVRRLADGAKALAGE